MNNLSEIFHPGHKFIRSSYGAGQGWDASEKFQFILYRGIVIRVDTDINRGLGSSALPPASIQVKIIGEDNSSRDPKNELNTWAPPFMSLHNIVIPEVGEEVWLIREATTKRSSVYWLSRVAETDKVSKSLARENIATQTPQNRYQMNFKVEDIQDDATQTDINILSVRFKQGDVIQQGRSATYIRHTNDDNKLGVLDLGIKDPLNNNITTKPIVLSGNTQSIHFQSAIPKDFTNLEKIDNQAVVETGEIVSSNEEEIASSKIINIADQIYNIADNVDDNKLSKLLVLYSASKPIKI